MTARTMNLAQFRDNKVPVLVVTDVAARGLDIPLVNTVIHFDCPTSPKLYVHRTGRTARGGREGTSVVFATAAEIPYILDVPQSAARNDDGGVESVGRCDADTPGKK